MPTSPRQTRPPRLTCENAVDAALVALTAARLSRLVTTDEIGRRYVRLPVHRWASEHVHFERVLDEPGSAVEEDTSFPGFLASGLGCPFCVGFWIGAATLASYAVARRRPGLLTAWRGVASALSLNYVVGHVSSRLD